MPGIFESYFFLRSFFAKNQGISPLFIFCKHKHNVTDSDHEQTLLVTNYQESTDEELIFLRKCEANSQSFFFCLCFFLLQLIRCDFIWKKNKQTKQKQVSETTTAEQNNRSLNGTHRLSGSQVLIKWNVHLYFAQRPLVLTVPIACPLCEHSGPFPTSYIAYVLLPTGEGGGNRKHEQSQAARQSKVTWQTW